MIKFFCLLRFDQCLCQVAEFQSWRRQLSDNQEANRQNLENRYANSSSGAEVERRGQRTDFFSVSHKERGAGAAEQEGGGKGEEKQRMREERKRAR